MIYSIVRQSIEIRLRFENVPKIYADSECAAAIGILAKKCGLALPQRRDDFPTMKKELEQQIEPIPETDILLHFIHAIVIKAIIIHQKFLA